MAVDSGWIGSGISLGTGDVAALKAPRVVLAWDAPTQRSRRAGRATCSSAASASPSPRSAWRRCAARSGQVDVLVLPSGAYSDAFDDEQVRRLRDWMRGGGTLVTLADASRWAAREKVNLLETRTELRGGKPDVEEKDKKPTRSAAALRLRQGHPARARAAGEPPGAIVRVTLDREHWLSAGLDGEIQALVEGQRIFTPIKLDKGMNVGVYASKDKLVVSGVVWDDARRSGPTRPS